MAAAPPPFHAMTEGTAAQWREIARGDREYAALMPERMLTQLEMLADPRHGFAIDRLGHCLQAATRALRDGRDEEYVVCALLHDIGDVFAPTNHAEYAALVLRPFVSEQNHWMLRHHGIFQGYYFNHFFGGDRNLRERHRGHAWFDYTAEFCELYDQCAFDPGYQSLPLAEFAPMLRRVLATPARAG
jgi:predicted HD phosphohydrolase